jgi:hypothetical protein
MNQRIREAGIEPAIFRFRTGRDTRLRYTLSSMTTAHPISLPTTKGGRGVEPRFCHVMLVRRTGLEPASFGVKNQCWGQVLTLPLPFSYRR